MAAAWSYKCSDFDYVEIFACFIYIHTREFERREFPGIIADILLY